MLTRSAAYALDVCGEGAADCHDLGQHRLHKLDGIPGGSAESRRATSSATGSTISRCSATARSASTKDPDPPMKTSLCVVLMAFAATALAPSAASAEEDIEQAKALYNAGAQAYAATRYRDAVQSFEAAYRKAPRPALLFSLAQAYRRLYVVEQSPEALRAAIPNYRRYGAVPQGGRRADATEALRSSG